MRVPLAFLLGKLNFKKEFQDIQARPEGPDTFLTAIPRSNDLPYTKVEFLVTPGYQIRRVQVTGFDRSVIDFQFEQEKLNPSIDAKLFRFEMPPGAQLVEESQ